MSVELSVALEEVLAEQNLCFYQDRRTKSIKILDGQKEDVKNAPVTFWVKDNTLFLIVKESFNNLRRNHRAILVMDYIAQNIQDDCKKTNLNIDNKVLPDLKVIIMANLPFQPSSSIHSS